ncbi:MAG TPA: HAD family hydrolase [Candidatus Limnocylindria bacterium]|jgi:FMN phosphatase YigB (HAD superfamily)
MSVAFLLDADNTLLDNDAAKDAIEAGIRALLPPGEDRRFWELYEAVRAEKDYVDLPATVARFATEHPFAPAAALERLLDTFPYADHLYPHVLAVLAGLRPLGPVAILSDGDPVFQPRKIERAGLAAAVDAVFVYAHKDRMLDDVLTRLPADRHIFVDDRAAILARIKDRLGAAAVTVHVRQGHFGDDPAGAGETAPDRVIGTIADLASLAPSL